VKICRKSEKLLIFEVRTSDYSSEKTKFMRDKAVIKKMKGYYYIRELQKLIDSSEIKLAATTLSVFLQN